MPAFIPVQVPEDLVVDVYQFIAQRQAAAEATVSPETSSGTDVSESDYSRDWTEEQLKLLFESDATSVQLMARVLSILAPISPTSRTITEIGEELGMEGLTIQKKFGGASRWMRKRFGGDIRWPISWAGNGGWYMNEHNAELWLRVIG